MSVEFICTVHCREVWSLAVQRRSSSVLGARSFAEVLGCYAVFLVGFEGVERLQLLKVGILKPSAATFS